MNFEGLGKESKKLLEILINNEDFSDFKDNDLVFQDLIDKGLITATKKPTRGFLYHGLTQKGKTYFEMEGKQRELQQCQNYTINVTAQHNSPVNINQGSGTAVQNIEEKSNIKTNKNSLSKKKIFEIVVGIAGIIGAIATVLALLLKG